MQKYFFIVYKKDKNNLLKKVIFLHLQKIKIMRNNIPNIPYPVNEDVKNYEPNSSDKELVLQAYKEFYNDNIDIPMWINGQDVYTDNKKDITPPHDHKHIVGSFSLAEKSHVDLAIESALKAREKWAAMPWQSRVAIFLKAADLIATRYRYKINAATMVGQSKNIYQAEIDAACEFIDFLRFNAYYVQEIYSQQPDSSDGVWNQINYRPLEGFVYAISPFNFTAIAGNLPASAAIMGNVVVWKPSDYQIYSTKIIIDIFKEAGLPDGVINAVYGDPEMITSTVLDHPSFAGLHFTGSTFVFKDLWKKIGTQIDKYKTYPKIVGETGGKDFIIAHPTANPEEVATGIIRAGFEYQGQKCSAASRIYLPESIANVVLDKVAKEVKEMKMGSPENFENFITAVIHRNAFDRLKNVIEEAKKSDEVEILVGGTYDDSKGYFVSPTVLVTSNPKYTTMETELFGPIVTVYVYKDNEWENTLKLVDSTSIYALTGAVFSGCRYAAIEATNALENAAGNFYINDKPTGAVVGQQPFGGARASGTNDKAGSIQNLMRWISPRLIKETFTPPKDYKYPFLG